MSVIVVLKEKDKYIVGCDTRISSDDGLFIDDYYQVKKAKHIDFNNEVIIGAVGRVSILDIVEHIISEMKTLNKRTIITELIPKLQKSILNTPCCNQHFEMEAEIILAIKNKAYSISSDYLVKDIQNEYVVGSGASASYGSLYTSRNLVMSAEERVALAILSAASVDYHVSSEVYIGDTKGKVFKRIETTI